MHARISLVASRLMIVTLSLVLLTSTGCHPTPSPETVDDGATPGSVNPTDAEALVGAINAARGTPLAEDPVVVSAAQYFSAQLSAETPAPTTYQYALTDGTDCQTLLSNSGVSYTSAIQIGATNYMSSASLLATLQTNTPVWNQLMSSKYKRIGIGVAEAGSGSSGVPSTNYWTILLLN